MRNETPAACLLAGGRYKCYFPHSAHGRNTVFTRAPFIQLPVPTWSRHLDCALSWKIVRSQMVESLKSGLCFVFLHTNVTRNFEPNILTRPQQEGDVIVSVHEGHTHRAAAESGMHSNKVQSRLPFGTQSIRVLLYTQRGGKVLKGCYLGRRCYPRPQLRIRRLGCASGALVLSG